MLLRLFSYFKKVKWLLCRNVWIKHKQVYVQREFLWGRLMCKFSPRLSLRNLPPATVNSSVPTPQVCKRHLTYLFCCLCACHCPYTKSWLNSCCGTKQRLTYQKTILHGGSLHMYWTASSLLRRRQNSANLHYCKGSQRVIHSISTAQEQSEMGPSQASLKHTEQKPPMCPSPDDADKAGV